MNENFVGLIVLAVVVLLILGAIWYVVTRFLVNVGATEVGIKERRYAGKKMSQGRVVATDGEIGIQRRRISVFFRYVVKGRGSVLV